MLPLFKITEKEIELIRSLEKMSKKTIKYKNNNRGRTFTKLKK